MLNVEEHYIDLLTEAVYKVLKGDKVEELVLPNDFPDNEVKQLYTYFNRLMTGYNELSEFIFAMARGELEWEAPHGQLVILQSFKSLQANLKHLTWVTQQIAGGDFRHKVDFMGEFSEAFNDMTRQLKEAFETIRKDKEKIDALLHNILPAKVIDELEETGRTTPKVFDNVTIFFSDIVGFTEKSSEIDPVMLIDELNGIFTIFDKVVNETYGERIKTIGDAYLAAWGMHNPIENHAQMAVKAAIKIIERLKRRNADWCLQWEIRIGIHTGSIVGGVVGNSKFIYDIFGDTVNTASRMESNSEPMKINISEDVYNLVCDDYKTIERGIFKVKGKGDCKMYFVDPDDWRGL